MQNPKQQPSGFVGAFCSSFMWLVSVSVAGVVLMGLLSFLHAMAVFDVALVFVPALPLLLPPVMALRNPNHRTGWGLVGILTGMVMGLLVEGMFFLWIGRA